MVRLDLIDLIIILLNLIRFTLCVAAIHHTILICPDRRISCAEAPTRISYTPGTTTHPCTFTSSHTTRSFLRRFTMNSIDTFFPGCIIFVFTNPRNCSGAAPALRGNTTYNCAISAPARLPTFSTLAVTMIDAIGGVGDGQVRVGEGSV